MIAKKSQLMLNRVKEGREQDFSFLFCKGHYFRQPLLESHALQCVKKPFERMMLVMEIRVVEFSNGGYKIRKIFAEESTYPKKIIEF